VVPDVELDLGLTRWLEVDLDAALSVTELEKRDKPLAGDPIFLSARFDAYSWKSPRSSATFGVGFQLGPRFPSVNTPRGVGFGGLVLFGGGSSDFHLVGNAGSVFDRGQSRAIAYGLDWDAALGHALSLIGDVSVVQYFGSDPAQLLVDVGASYKPSPALELFALAIAGPALRGDRAGGLVGVAYTYRVFHVGE